MMLPVKCAFWLVCLFFLWACTPIYNKSKLTLIKTPFQFEKVTFLTDGYYYHIKDSKTPLDSIIQSGIVPMIFFQDGYVHRDDAVHGKRPHSNDLERRDSIRKSLKEYENYLIRWNQDRNGVLNISGWGLYKQYGNELLVQQYTNHGGKFILVEYYGKVINPRTIVFTGKHYFGHPLVMEERQERIHELFEFVPRKVKPDSSNYIRSNRVKFDPKSQFTNNQW